MVAFLSALIFNLTTGWFALLHTFTTFPLLLPIHLVFSEGDSPASMTRASISSLTNTAKGRSLLWIHLIVIFWISITWMITLLWISFGLMRMRATNLHAAAANHPNRPKTQYRHPHPQYFFQPDVDPMMRVDDQYKGVRYRTIMVANIPGYLRDEQQLKEYFEYYLARKIAKPTIGINTSTQPGFINRYLSYFWNRLKRTPPNGCANPDLMANLSEDGHTAESSEENKRTAIVERVTVVRRMSQLATLLERREEVLRVLETAHIRLACKVLTAVAACMKDRPGAVLTKSQRIHRNTSAPLLGAVKFWKNEVDVENDAGRGDQEGENRMDLLIRTIGPFVKEFSSQERTLPSFPRISLYKKPQSTDNGQPTKDGESGSDQLYDHRGSEKHKTIWDALLSLPRSVLDPYQPLIHLNSLFRGKTVPTIDYYTAKLQVLTSLITEARSLPLNGYDPVSTAFVTFETPKDARRACKYLAVHPDNPLVCTVSMAPLYEDVDWTRIMKLPYNLEVRTFLQFHRSCGPPADLFLNQVRQRLGYQPRCLVCFFLGGADTLLALTTVCRRAFTIFWVFPISLFVGLVSIQNISAFLPSLVRQPPRGIHMSLTSRRRKDTWISTHGNPNFSSLSSPLSWSRFSLSSFPCSCCSSPRRVIRSSRCLRCTT